MNLITALIVILLLGLGFWANNSYIAEAGIRLAINIILVIFLIFMILKTLGIAQHTLTV